MKEFIRGAVRLHVLHHASQREIHGAWLTGELAEHGHKISPGTLYPMLHRMEAEGLLRAREDLVEGRWCRFYRITARGRTELAEMRRALHELAREVLEVDG